MGGSSRHERDRDYSEGSSSRRSRQDDSGNVSSGTASEVGREFANRYGGLFSEKDWKCTICSNINWARRAECNQCKTPKPGSETTMGSREGRGGGFMERDEVVEYKKSRDAEKDEEWDEFGRKRRKNRDSGIYNNGNDSKRESWAAWNDIIGNEDTKEEKNEKKNNRNRSIDDREQSKKPRLYNQHRRRSSRSRSPCRRDRSLSSSWDVYDQLAQKYLELLAIEQVTCALWDQCWGQQAALFVAQRTALNDNNQTAMSQEPENTSDFNSNQVNDADSYRDNQPSLPHTDSQISQASTITGMDQYSGIEDDDEIHKDINSDIDNKLDDKLDELVDLRSFINGSQPFYSSNGLFNHDNHESAEDIEMMNNGSSRYESDSESGPQSSKRIKRKKLDEILRREDGEADMDDETMTDADQELEQETVFPPIQEGLCVECRDQEASFFCEQCNEDFCEVCFAMIHRTGSRRNHTKKNLKNEQSSDTLGNSSQGVEPVSKQTSNGYTSFEETSFDDPDVESKMTSFGSSRDDMASGKRLVERSKYIPIRLNIEERKLLRLLEAALNVSEYTDKIDILSPYNKKNRIILQIKELCSILSGLVVASDYKKGQEMFANKSYEENEEFYQNIFEIGRRHKIMNPEKMRDAYGKLMYMLMDSMIPEVQSMLSFNLVKPIKTVYSFLEERGGIDLLYDERVAIATREIKPEGKSRYQINSEIRQKERAVETISRKYETFKLSSDDIKMCLYSIGDNNSYLRANRDCCDRMLKNLINYFNPRRVEDGYSLAIRSGSNGARLTHNHEMQYCYANQTLSLWSEIQNEMFMLWFLADHDMLSDSNIYRLRDTGQGLNRVQNCPAVSKAMHTILHRAQQKAGHWVGSSVIHLGDKNVPNALMFIDKYNQVSRILNPILICLDNIEPLVGKNPGIRTYISNSFGGVEELTKKILADFFRYAFDGSGADNFFDAGSCIDGRLTSAWNWCSLIEKKSYFPVFLLTGFVGFDGE
ncbi:6296_t:CDS:10, partial [Dentiscutata erythropus]